MTRKRNSDGRILKMDSNMSQAGYILLSHSTADENEEAVPLLIARNHQGFKRCIGARVLPFPRRLFNTHCLGCSPKRFRDRRSQSSLSRCRLIFICLRPALGRRYHRLSSPIVQFFAKSGSFSEFPESSLPFLRLQHLFGRKLLPNTCRVHFA